MEDSTTFGTQTETFEIKGDGEGVLIINSETRKVVMALSNEEANQLAALLREKAS